ncbi:hypothetical protein Gocc_1478 [Gaiella occulta]|uniref:Uncharacterized protein n=1 Tax=Gaiella occulta TaxID=1002870 RepID=A0A7M2YYK7_9ACTN|nr:hypothetical protein Gocc_1478 [Gaiella occulta]
MKRRPKLDMRGQEATGMLRACEHPGCTTITLGGTCVAHDSAAVVQAAHPIGRACAKAPSDLAAR